MSRSSDRLLELIGEVDDSLLDEAADYRPGKRKHWQKWLAQAAVLTLAVGLSGTWLLSLRGCGSSSGPKGSAIPGGPYQIYAGPNLPLTLAEDDPSITARRHLTLDFLPTTPQWREDRPDETVTEEMLEQLEAVYAGWSLEDGTNPKGTYSDLMMVDRYTLTNHSPEDRTVRALYPVPTSLAEGNSERPQLWAEGVRLETASFPGSYNGPYGDVSPWSGEKLDVTYPDSWEGWAMQLQNGDNLARALEPFEEPERIPVKVYRFSDPTGPADAGDAPNPSIRVRFHLDYDRTSVLPMGFQGGRWRREEGLQVQSFSIPEEHEPWEEARLVVLGDDIQDLTVGGYITGGTDEDTPTLEGCYVTVEEFDSDLYTELYRQLERQEALPFYRHMPGPEESCPLLWQEVQHILSLPLGEWDTHWVELFSWFRERPRIIWQGAELTIPAGGSVELTVLTRREGSFDVGGGAEPAQGYDFLPTMGSNLHFEGQTAALETRDRVELAGQNFGFDPDNGVTEVELDLEEPRYYLEVYFK